MLRHRRAHRRLPSPSTAALNAFAILLLTSPAMAQPAGGRATPGAPAATVLAAAIASDAPAAADPAGSAGGRAADATATATGGGGGDPEQTTPPPVATPPGQDGLLGSWGGTRTDLHSRGVAVGATAILDMSRVPRQGQRAAFAGRMLLDARAELDLGSLLGLPNVTGFVQYYGKVGTNGSDIAADFQGFSNIDADDFRGLGETWIQVAWPDDVARLKLGRIDANTEFAGLHSSEGFVNSSMGFSPTIWGLPTYPDPRRGMVVAAALPSWLDLSGGLFERTEADAERPGRSHRQGWLWMGQARAKWQARPGLDGTASVGVWRHTGRLTRLDGGEDRSTSGPFVTFEQTVWRERGREAGDETSQHAHVFFQYGTASAVVSEVTRHVGTGVAVRAPLASRRDDMVGIGATHVRLSTAAAESPGGSELAVGPFYQARLTSWLMVQPDLQWLVQRAADGASRTSLLLTCRLEVEF